MATTPDNTRRETIEAKLGVIISKLRTTGPNASPDCTRSVMADILEAALASAEPQPHEATFSPFYDGPDRWEVGFRNIVSIIKGPREQFDIKDVVEQVRELAARPAPAPAAETAEPGLVERLTRENDILRGLVANGPGDCVYCGLSRADMGKCQSGFPGCDRADDMACAPEPNTAQLGARTQPPADVTEALRWYFDMLEEQVHGHSAQSSIWWGKSVTFERHEQARRLLASTGSRQEPAGDVLLEASPDSYWLPIVEEVKRAGSKIRHAQLLNHQAAHLLAWATIARDAAVSRTRLTAAQRKFLRWIEDTPHTSAAWRGDIFQLTGKSGSIDIPASDARAIGRYVELAGGGTLHRLNAAGRTALAATDADRKERA